METVAEMRVSNDALNDSEELRRRIARNGYLFFRGLLDAEPVWNLRLRTLEVLRGIRLVGGRYGVGRWDCRHF